MKSLSNRIAFAAILSAWPAWAIAQEVPPTPIPPPLPAEAEAASPNAEEDFEVLNRGPIHEAFADQIPNDITDPEVVPREPPEPINEVPPEVKPSDDAIWIPGYFMFSDTDNDFIWISGVWRVPPPTRQWTPGYWAKTDGGFVWVPGFWAQAEAQQLNYLPYPPESLDTGPTSPAPTTDHYWVNGCWQWSSAQYAWSPGYWNTYRTGWTWIPNRYHWSPRGAVYVGGYWDYPLARRGLLFAPIRYHRPIYRNPGYFYRPHYAVQPASILLHLFVHAGHRHLYYGDYYGSRYRNLGYRSWGSYRYRNSYLPSYTYYQQQYRRQGVDFGDRLNSWSKYYDKYPQYHPAHTIADSRLQAERYRNDRTFARESVFTNVATELANRVANGSNSFRRTGDRDRDQFDRDRRDLAEIRSRREQFEQAGEAIGRADRNGRLPGDRDQRSEVARPTLQLPDHLADADRRQRIERQASELRQQILGRTGATDNGRSQDRFGSERGDREGVSRSDFTRERINRGDLSRGSDPQRTTDAARDIRDRTPSQAGDSQRSALIERINAARAQANQAREAQTRDRTPGTSNRGSTQVPSRTERPTIDLNQLREQIQNRSRSQGSSNRFTPGTTPSGTRPSTGDRSRTIPSGADGRGNPATSNRSSSQVPSRTERPTIDLNRLREQIQNRSRSQDSSNRFTPGTLPSRTQPSTPSRIQSDSRFRQSTPSGSGRAPSASPPTSSSRSINRSSPIFNRGTSTPSTRSSSPSIKSSIPSARSSSPSRFGGSSQPRASTPRSSSRSIGGSSRSSSGRSSSRGSFGGRSSGRSSRGK